MFQVLQKPGREVTVVEPILRKCINSLSITPFPVVSDVLFLHRFGEFLTVHTRSFHEKVSLMLLIQS